MNLLMCRACSKKKMIPPPWPQEQNVIRDIFSTFTLGVRCDQFLLSAKMLKWQMRLWSGTWIAALDGIGTCGIARTLMSY